MSCNDNFADANRARVAYIREVDFCVFPDPADMQIARITSSDLATTKETSPSDEIRSDRQVSDLAALSYTSGGSLGFEKSLTTFDEFLAGALCNEWQAGTVINTSFDVVADTPLTGQATIEDPLTGGEFTGVEVGQQLFISNGVFVGWFKVIEVISVDEIIVTDPNNYLTTGEYNLTMNGDSLQNGVEKISFSLEQAFLDAGFYQLFHGQRVGTWSLEVAAQSKITGSFAFQGTEVETSSTEYGTSYIDATDTPIINATSNVGTVLVEGVELDTCIQSISIELDNALRVQAGVGSKYPCGIGLGRQTITGNLSAYFVNGQLYNTFLNHTNASLQIPMFDTAGNSLLIELPKIKFSSDAPAPSAIDTDIMDEIDYQAIFDVDSGFTIRLTRGAVPALITTTTGIVGAPAEIEIYGNFLAGSTFDCLIKTPLNPAGNGAPLTLTSDATAEEVALLWADLIKGIDEVTAQAVGNKVTISPFDPGVSIDEVSDLIIVPA